MFKFPEQEYKWCVECRGNIRKDAFYCKFCHKPVGSKLLQAKLPQNVGGFITEAARQLPSFDDILQSMPAEFRKRIDDADNRTAPPHIGLRPGVDPIENRQRERNSNICPPNPPNAIVSALVWDILISLHAQGLSLTKICSDPRLQLIELSPGEITAEHEQRVREINGGHKCKHCAEFVQSDDEVCRFCGGTAQNPPTPINSMLLLTEDISRFDPTLLRNILIWEAAKRRIDEAPSLEQEVLNKNRITEDEVNRQILTLRQNPDQMPRSRWRQRMFDLGISPGYLDAGQEFDLDYFMLEDIAMLGRALTPDFTINENADAQQALIVFDHALNRWQNNRFYAQQKYHLLSGKSMVYLHLKDDERYQRFKRASDEALLEMMPEEMRESMKESLKDPKIDPLLEGLNKMDPEQRLQALEDAEKNFIEGQSERLDRMNALIPGLGEVFQGISAHSNQILQVSKYALKARSALEKSDPDLACREFESAIALSGTEVHDVSRRAELLLELANAQLVKGDKQSAEDSFKRAFADAADVLEADLDPNPSSQAHHKYACYLRDSGSYPSAEEHFLKAISFYAQSRERLIEKGWLPADSSRDSWRMKEEYAKLLDLMARYDEAKVVAAESAVLKEQEEEEERQHKLKRSKEKDSSV